MLVMRGSGRLGRRGRVAGTLAVGAIGFTTLLSLTAGGPAVAASAAQAATCAQGSGPHLAGQKITAAKIAPYVGTSGLECADFAGSNLSGLSLIQFDLTKADLKNANLSNANLGQATLSGADLAGANLSGANLIQATMNGVNLTGANLKSAKLGQATLTGSDLSGASLQSANLEQTTLTHANLSSANLSNADLEEAQAQNASFKGANLDGADFTAATLTGAQFGGAKTQGTNFTSATGGPSSGGSPGGGSGAAGSSAVQSPVSRGDLRGYLIGICAALLIGMLSVTIRRSAFSRNRTSGFGGTPGIVSAYGTPGYSGSGYGSGIGGGFGGPTAADGAPSNMPGTLPGTVPGSFGPGGATQWDQPPGGVGTLGGLAGRATLAGGRPPGTGGKIVMSVIGALLVAGGLYLLGSEIISAVIVQSGSASYLCSTDCGSRIENSAAIPLILGLVAMFVGGVFRRVSRPRWF